MEVKSNLRQIVVYNAPTPCYYTVNIPGAEGPITVAGNSGPTVANSLKGLFPDFDFPDTDEPELQFDEPIIPWPRFGERFPFVAAVPKSGAHGRDPSPDRRVQAMF